MHKNKTIPAIDIHYYGKENGDNPPPVLGDKTRLYNDQNNIIGTVGYERMIAL